jgi:hypothetical protein
MASFEDESIAAGSCLEGCKQPEKNLLLKTVGLKLHLGED